MRDNAGAETVHVVREITHFAEDDSGSRRGEGASTYSNSFTALPNTVPWRQPMATARPRMEGLHTANVLAPSGEEIHTDDQGRIKIRFFWDWREDATADNSEWVRVVQPWAGNQWGGQFIPRVDTEVAVAFMDADPDRPIVVGGFYNGNDKPIFPVAEKTKLGFRSRSVTKGGTDDFNEILLRRQEGQRNGLSACPEGHDDRGRARPEAQGRQRPHRHHQQGNEKVTIEQGDQTTELKLGDISVKCRCSARSPWRRCSRSR